MHRYFAVVPGIVFTILPALGDAAEPRVLVEGYALEQVAKEPDIVTPIGMAFDGKGRLLVVESHTHQRPENYEGPAGDRIRMFSDSDGDGRLDRWSTFAEGFQQAMNLCARPDGGVYLVTRRDVRLLEDADDDGRAEKETPILRLETEADYPHNGLSGIAIDVRRGADGGTLYVGLGENFGAAYRLVGSDGAALEGRGGSGTIFQCRPDGGQLRRVATGFWNPFGLCVTEEPLFCIDNDPDSSPPCRLLQIEFAGDYGHRWEYGRAGVHPLQAWNGELPGTLPMVCGVGEAPTALVYHRGYLWVTSWGDHRVERYMASIGSLRPKRLDASLQVAVQGDAEFRPTGAAVGPDGSLYFADWVDRSYPVHGRGRIWRLRLKDGDEIAAHSDSQLGPLRWGDWDGGPGGSLQTTIATGQDPANGRAVNWERDADPARRLAELQGRRWRGEAGAAATLRRALTDDDADVRLYAVRWIADERIAELRDDVAKLLEGDIPTERYFLAVLAAIEWLDGDSAPRTSGISDGLLRRELANESRSPQLHALALRLISPDHEWLTTERLREYLASESPELRLEAVRTLAMQTRPERFAVLAEISADESRDAAIRAEAVAGLASAAGEYESLLTKLADGAEPNLTKEAARVLRLSRKRAVGAGVDPEQDKRPETTNLEAWNALLAERGDAESGRRLFFTTPGPLCAACHQHGGRGGRVGPDLTRIGQQQSRERIIASILQPSQEIAPHYQAWELVTDSGLIRVGLRLPKAGDDGVEPYADAEGRPFELKSEEIELRTPSSESIMPGGLVDGLTIEDLRDIVAFLSATD